MAYQIVLMRIYAIAQWHHFAYMIISIAMLGFGAAGTLFTILKPQIIGREQGMLTLSTFLLSISMPLCYALGQWIPFETFHLVSQPSQLGWLFLLYLVLAIPFFLVSTIITLSFFLTPKHIGRVYFVNLLGSGLGAAAVVGLLFRFPPDTLPYLLSLPVLTMAWLLSRTTTRAVRATGLLSLLLLAGWLGIAGMQPLRLSSYKTLSYIQQFPDTEIIAQAQSPLSFIHVARSALIRETPGQLGRYPFSEKGPLPTQIGLIFDAGSISAVNQAAPSYPYLEYATPAVAYHVTEAPHVLVIGAGGGTDVWMALQHGARHVTAIEVDPSVFPLMDVALGEFSGHLYRRSDVTPVVAEGRGFLQARDARYDLIQIALIDAFNAAASGVYALSESYLYTREAVQLYLDHLSDDGVLAITRWLKTPPRDAIKLFATFVEAAEAAGLDDPGAHLAFLRSWNTATILLSRSPWTETQLSAIRAFAVSRGFDMDWLPGLQPGEINRYTIMERPLYAEAAVALLSPQRQEFYRDYLFDVRPATDDRPYFFQFFKWSTLQVLWREMGWEWVPFVEWGYIALLATMVQGGLAGLLLILLPLWRLGRLESLPSGVKGHVVVYFTALGIAFMFLEIAFIQKFMLFLAYPIYAVAVVLTGFLIFSGLGSLLADQWRGNRSNLVTAAVAVLSLIAICYVVFLPAYFRLAAGWSDGARVGLSLLFIAPMAFCMGIPFPTGLQRVSDRYASLLPWAWGINGCASVVGASMATFTAIHFGFRTVVLSALVIYAVAALVLSRLYREDERDAT